MQYRLIRGVFLVLLMFLAAFTARAFAAATDGQITIPRRGAHAPKAASAQSYIGTVVHIAFSERIEGKDSPRAANVADEEYGFVNPNEMPLTMQKIALIAAFTASGDIDRLKQVLVEGLEAGLTVNQIKEVLIHTYAYAGFPRALNGINAFIAIMDDRGKQGLKDEHGPEANPVTTDKSKYEYGRDVLDKLRNPAFAPGPAGSLKRSANIPRYETFTPTIEVFLKEHLFADIFIRDVLDYRSREIATVGVISNLPGANAQLRSHIGLAMAQGFTEQQMRHLFTVMGKYFGKERGDNAMAVLQQVLDTQKKEYDVLNSSQR